MANELLIRVVEDLAAHYRGVRIAAPRLLGVKAAGATQTIVLRLLSQYDTYAPVALRVLTSDGELPAPFRSWTGAMHAELQRELIWEGMFTAIELPKLKSHPPCPVRSSALLS
jgi:hypothetical protein